MKGSAAEPEEWLEPDSCGGFASGTADGVRTRRYHAVMLAAANPPGDRTVFVNALEAWLETSRGKVALTSHRYRSGLIYPSDVVARSTFALAPWPKWRIDLPSGGALTFELFVAPGSGQTSMRWALDDPSEPARLRVRLLMSGRDYHALHHENAAFRFDPIEREASSVVWQLYPGLLPLAAHGGEYVADPLWYRDFFYSAEAARGLDCVEDLASPGILSWDLAAANATLALRTDRQRATDVDTLAKAERQRRAALPNLHHSALQFVVARADGLTIIAGYPWFTDWGRDTFIGLRGILIATGRHDEARKVLLAWAKLVDEGMLPNRFPDGNGLPEFNAVDASLWFIVAVHDLFCSSAVTEADMGALQEASRAILEGYSAGTRYGIRLDADGLLASGEHGVQLTWMDAMVGNWVVTPRVGKPVEIQALWINALAIAAQWPCGERWSALEQHARSSFVARFPDEETGGLVDVVDVDGVAGTCDRRIRPNQILAAGGLPFVCVPPSIARSIVDVVESRLLTPLGLRTLDPADPGYHGSYEGGVRDRDRAYHQGTAWPWLLDPFVDAWLQSRDRTDEARAEGRARFLVPLQAHLDEAGLGSVSEIVDGDWPHMPRGCPFQAWSVGALVRIEQMLETRA